MKKVYREVDNMKVLVTGSSGLIGMWVCNSLREHGAKVVGLDVCTPIPGFEWLTFHQCDIL